MAFNRIPVVELELILVDKSNMKRLSFLLMCLSVAAILQAATVIRLENDTDTLAYYTSVPLAAIPTDKALQSEFLASKIIENLPTASYLPPGGAELRFAVPEQASRLVLMSLNAGQWQFSVLDVPKARDVKAAGAYLLLSSGTALKGSDGSALITRALDLTMPKTLVRIDGRFVDWLAVPDQLFSPAGQYHGLYRAQGGARIAIKPEEAISTSKAGTDLERIKATSDGTWLYLMASSYSQFGRGYSLLLRVFPKDAKNNPWTLEVPVRSGPGGQSFLWTGEAAAGAKPVDVGDFSWVGLFLESRIKLDLLPVSLRKALLAPGTQIEVWTAWGDGSLTEEWYYGNFESKAVPGLR